MRLSRNALLGVVVIGFVAALVDAPCAWAQTTAAPVVSDVVVDGNYTWNLPPDVSRHGHRIDQLIHVTHWFMAVLFFGWGAFFVYCLAKFRRRAGHRAEYQPVKAKISKYGELGVAGFEAVLLLVFSVPIWASVKNDLPDANKEHIRVRVLAEQFAWNFHYPGPDGIFGKTASHLVDTALNPMGLDKDNDPAAKDDIVSGEFRIPVETPIICDIMSKDVIHSFFLPVMRVKQDAIPGMRVPVWFEAVKTGNYEVACAQLCGNNHYSMRALMVIEPREAFDAWLVEKGKPPVEFEE